MTPILDEILSAALNDPMRCALTDGEREVSYAVLHAEVGALGNSLRQQGVKTLGIYADNGIGWIVADLASLESGICCVPLPQFFSDAQLRHAMGDSGMDAILVRSNDRRIPEIAHAREDKTHVLDIAGQSWQLLQLQAQRAQIPAGTAKITYTSGTTGNPKGVCLSAATLMAVARSLRVVTAAGPADRHLSVLPLSTLLENLAGVYTPLMAGATVCVPPQASVGMRGAAGLDTPVLIAAMHGFKATTAILVPQLLLALAMASEMGEPVPAMRFVAVGGAPVSNELMKRAEKAGWPVFQGYGLSECASVVALSTPDLARPGSVGQVLPHLEVRIASDNEIQVRGSAMLGYTGSTTTQDEWISTGDLGYLDAQDFLYVDGRKKNMFITAFGRNVAPEWVERELGQFPAVAQAAVFGEGKPWNAAVISVRPLPGRNLDVDIVTAIESANQQLPDYARIHRWILADQPFSFENHLLTSNGRVRREQVHARYRQQLESLYQE